MMKGALQTWVHTGSSDETRHRVQGELCSHPPPQTREAEGPRRNELSQEHPPGRGEVPSLRGPGISGLKVKLKLFTYGGIADCLYNSPRDATETTGG